jgi:hypothetical protein
MASSSDDQDFAEAATAEAGLRSAAKIEDYEPSNTSIDIRQGHNPLIGML